MVPNEIVAAGEGEQLDDGTSANMTLIVVVGEAAGFSLQSVARGHANYDMNLLLCFFFKIGNKKRTPTIVINDL